MVLRNDFSGGPSIKTNNAEINNTMYCLNTELLKQQSVGASLCFSLEGVMPSFEEKRIDIFPVRLDPGLCFCISKCRPGWEIIPGCEAVLNALCLVVKAGLKKLRRHVTEKLRFIYKRAKLLVRFSAPRCLRL